MDRRKAIKQLIFLAGGSVSLSTLSAVLAGCNSKSSIEGLRTLTARQNEKVIVLSDLIIPETETPGARTAGVNRFIDKMLTDWNTPEEKEHFLKELDYVDEISITLYQEDVLNLTGKQQTHILKELAKDAQKEQPVTGDNALKPFFNQIKEYTVVGYYSSEISASQVLKLNLAPGYLDACVPYNEVGKAWSLPK